MRDACKRLADAGIQVSLFIDADEEQIKAAAEVAHRLSRSTPVAMLMPKLTPNRRKSWRYRQSRDLCR
ncbi:pyridoxine 5'-phosphate synthase [Escherichia coli]|uniref:Pyridoxine 5'-phosphate synthase n=1 Tax=Escherichia coli TaxID=562 RepID=A0A377C8F8_ECOLX|nr:pyridoxine 5'-phosphate synthase [Escherichia coli]